MAHWRAPEGARSYRVGGALGAEARARAGGAGGSPRRRPNRRRRRRRRGGDPRAAREGEAAFSHARRGAAGARPARARRPRCSRCFARAEATAQRAAAAAGLGARPSARARGGRAFCCTRGNALGPGGRWALGVTTAMFVGFTLDARPQFFPRGFAAWSAPIFAGREPRAFTARRWRLRRPLHFARGEVAGRRGSSTFGDDRARARCTARFDAAFTPKPARPQPRAAFATMRCAYVFQAILVGGRAGRSTAIGVRHQ